MRFEQILIGLAVFFAVITLAVTFYESTMDNYNVDKDSDLFSNLTDEDYPGFASDIDSLRSSTLEGGADVTTEDTENSLYKSALNLIINIGSIIKTPARLIQKLTTKPGTAGLIPYFITNLWLNIIIILAIAFVIYMFMRFKPRN